MLPDPHHREPAIPKLPPGSIVAMTIPCNFGRPKLDSACGDASTLRTCMPEASVHKHGEADCRKVEVGATHDILWMLSPSGDFIGSQKGLHGLFRGLISSAPH